MTAPAAAQRAQDDTAYARAISAGYKALTYCNGIFLSGRSPAQIDAAELRGIYPEYDAIVPTLEARVDAGARSVVVGWSGTLPPRRAEWKPGSGCTLDPIGRPQPDIIAKGATIAATTPDPRAWPMGDAGIRPRPSPALAARVAAAFDRATYGAGHTIGVVILRDGSVVAERYADGWGPFVANRTWSAGKSIAGTLIGVAMTVPGVDVRPERPAAVPEWQSPGDPRGAITLDQLLRMASGLHSDTAGNRTDLLYFGGGLVTQDATHWPLEAAPGTRFRYANDDILLAVRALRDRLGEQRYASYPSTALFQPLGMSHTQAGTDWQGNYIISSQVWSTARDLARLGEFWRRDGVWQGKRMLPEGWVKHMTTPSGPQPASGPGYGATMWLFGPAQGLPAGSYAAQGNRGQYVMVVPSEHLVVVRRGEDPGAARFDIARFTADVIAAGR